MAEAISGIYQTLEGVDLDNFSNSWALQRAVERGLEIISEASRGLPEADKAAYPDVPWSEIAGIGNILRHEYHRVEPRIIWNIFWTHLPVLTAAVNDMLSSGAANGA